MILNIGRYQHFYCAQLDVTFKLSGISMIILLPFVPLHLLFPSRQSSLKFVGCTSPRRYDFLSELQVSRRRPGNESVDFLRHFAEWDVWIPPSAWQSLAGAVLSITFDVVDVVFCEIH